MNNPEEQQSYNEREIDGTDRAEQSSAVGDGSDSAAGGGVPSSASSSSRSGNDIGLTARLTNLFAGEGDGDLVIQRSNAEETVMQWLQALDMQVMGACRADERLKPLLKLNASSGLAEDRLLNHLSQNFEPSEVGLLARCLCIPLVSVRVGKVDKQERLLIPTSTRGNLTLSLLPTSDLRISFIGDDGHVERLSSLSDVLDCSSVVIEEIPADTSGRSFLMKIPDCEPFYFWCSEKSRLLGIELLEKMKNIFKRKPSLAELTGICESRLERFATHLRSYLVGPKSQNAMLSGTRSSSSDLEHCQSVQTTGLSTKPSRARHCNIQGAKSSSFYLGSLSPRASSFKESLPKTLASLRTVAREKLRRKGESSLSCVENNIVVSSSSICEGLISNEIEKNNPLVSPGTFSIPSSSGLGLELPMKVVNMPFLGSSPQFSPYYCWCPPVPGTSTLLPMSSTSSFSLPPLSSLMSAAPRSTSILAHNPPLNLSELPSLNFPPFLPEPLISLPLSMQASQQIPTFTPLMCDPIIHIPVIDICSSGQAYLVSAGPAMSTTIPPLPLVNESESMAEKSARETLRLLISGSSQVNPQLMGVLPSVDEKQSILVAGSRGLYVGARDVNVNSIASSIAAMGLVSLSERSTAVIRQCIGESDLVDLLEEPVDSGGTCSKDGGSVFSDLREESSE